MPRTFGFDYALRVLKIGGRVARLGWNGVKASSTEEMYLYIDGLAGMAAPHIIMRDRHGKKVAWLCSQTDAMATDWVLTENSEVKWGECIERAGAPVPLEVSSLG